MSFANIGREPLPAERDLVVKHATGFGKFHGDFIAKASIGDLPNFDHDRRRAQARHRSLGPCNGFSITYDLDRDGREETINVFFRQTSYG